MSSYSKESFVVYDESRGRLLITPNPAYAQYFKDRDEARAARPAKPKPDDVFEMNGWAWRWDEMITGDTSSSYSRYTGWSTNRAAREFCWIQIKCPWMPKEQIATPISAERPSPAS